MYFNSKDILVDSKIVAKVFRYKKKSFKGIEFFTKNNLNFQMGLMVHDKDHIIQPHVHINKKKIIKNMSEFLIIFKGKLRVDFYNRKKIKKKSIILNKKDMILIIAGAHGFKVLKKIEMLEIKQGPFKGLKDKVKFEKN